VNNQFNVVVVGDVVVTVVVSISFVIVCLTREL